MVLAMAMLSVPVLAQGMGGNGGVDILGHLVDEARAGLLVPRL